MFVDETLDLNQLDTSNIDEIVGGSARFYSKIGGVDFSDIEKISVFAVSPTDKEYRKKCSIKNKSHSEPSPKLNYLMGWLTSVSLL